jgi:hypothetical protein
VYHSAGLSVNFAPSTYGVNEGDTAVLMVVLSTPSDMEVTVVVRTTPGTATGKYRLYTEGKESQRFIH